MRNQPSTRSDARPVNPGGLCAPSRREPVVRAIAAEWRRLTSPTGASRNGPGAPTLVACSAGGDSSALVIALAAAAGRRARDWVTVAHVLHDMRPAAEAEHDRDRAARLADALGLGFVEASVRVRREGGNAEGDARRMRYGALAKMARERGVRYVATAHNSHDQVESVLMALLRGAGPRGLSGIAASRSLGERVRLIRPMLGVAPCDARALCARCNWEFVHDATNSDLSRLRNALRSRVLPTLMELRPSAPERIGSAARRCRESADAVTTLARGLIRRELKAGPLCFDRRALRDCPTAIVCEAMRQVAAQIGGQGVLDRLPARTLTAAARLIASPATDPKTLQWPGVTVTVDAHRVAFEAK